MNKLFERAKFIRNSDYEPYFDIDSSNWIKRSRLYQHTDLISDDGLSVFIKDFIIGSTEDTYLYFSALGCVDVFINGKRVGSDEMKPGCTNFHKRALYIKYDVSEYLVSGTNRILAVVASGWYVGRNVAPYYGKGEPAFIACIKQSGRDICTTDETWKTDVCGQIRTADIWDGEYRDGREPDYTEMSLGSFKVDEWKNAEIANYFTGELSEFVGPHVRVRENLNLKAEKITVTDGVNYNGSDYGEVNVACENASLPLKVKKGQTVTIDLGQEMVGWAKIKVRGESGTIIKMRFAEFLNDSGEISRGNDGPKGSVYTVNLRSALAKAYYVLAGKGEEVYRPTFTFFGYRYVELTAEGEYELIDFVSEVVGSDTRETGKLETSDKLVNKLISNTLWGQRSNYLSIPTDCPQRDERFGWTGDTQAFSVTAAYNADVSGFMKKWLQDARDSQSDEGAYPDIIPRAQCCRSEDASAWGDAGIIVPYNMYMMYGDKSIIEEHYTSMEKYISQLVINFGMSGPIPRYGDWLAYDYCENEFISSAYFVHDIDLMIKMSEAIDKEDRAEYYRKLREKAYDYFVENFMDDGKLIGQTQTDKVISLAFNLLDGDYAKEVADELEQQIRDNGFRLSTGFLGTYNLCPTLSKFGKDNMAYSLLMQRNEPSWLYSIDQGATTIWERWNSYTIENGFGDVGMNSFNHYAYGSVVEWIYRYAAGIEPSEPGFASFILQPRVDMRKGDDLPAGQKPMTHIKASFDSANGTITSEWEKGKTFTYKCTVPQGTSATLYLPVFAKKLTLNGKQHSVSEFKNEKGCAVIKLAEGSYVFEQ